MNLGGKRVIAFKEWACLPSCLPRFMWSGPVAYYSDNRDAVDMSCGNRVDDVNFEILPCRFPCVKSRILNRQSVRESSLHSIVSKQKTEGQPPHNAPTGRTTKETSASKEPTRYTVSGKKKTAIKTGSSTTSTTSALPTHQRYYYLQQN